MTSTDASSTSASSTDVSSDESSRRRTDSSSTIESLTLDADFEAVRDLEGWLMAAAAKLGFDKDDPTMAAIHLAVHEVATNCVDHATTDGDQLQLRADRRLVPDTDQGGGQPALVIEVWDSGNKAFAASTVATPSPDVPQVRGYGLMIAEQVAASVTYKRQQTEDLWSNRWTLVFENVVSVES